MHFALFLCGFGALIGSCLIVCICNKLKRRHLRDKGKSRPRTNSTPPMESFILERDFNGNSPAELNAIHILPSPALLRHYKDSIDLTKDHMDIIPSLTKPPVPQDNRNRKVIPTIVIYSVEDEVNVEDDPFNK